jgi:hypothetical protein
MTVGYLEMLRVPHAARLLTGTLVGRLPYGTAPLAIVIFTRAEGGSYSLAGVLAVGSLVIGSMWVPYCRATRHACGSLETNAVAFGCGFNQARLARSVCRLFFLVLTLYFFTSK